MKKDKLDLLPNITYTDSFNFDKEFKFTQC